MADVARFSSNALTKRYCERLGWLCETVQRFYGGRRHDLFGIADSIVVADGRVFFVQNCSYGSLKAHCDALSAMPAMARLMEAGTVECWEWRRKKAKRGGKRIARQWHLRRSTATKDGWTGPEPWSMPLDLYPKKVKPKRGEAFSWTKPEGMA